jgi:hypothetical protein
VGGKVEGGIALALRVRNRSVGIRLRNVPIGCRSDLSVLARFRVDAQVGLVTGGQRNWARRGTVVRGGRRKRMDPGSGQGNP